MMRFICSFYDLPAPIYPFLPFPNISWESKHAYNRLRNNTPLHRNVATNADVPGSWKTKVKVNETYRPYYLCIRYIKPFNANL